MEVKWIKLCVDLFQNPKVVLLRSEKGGDRLVLIWIMLLVLAGRCNRGGRLMLTDDIPYNTKMLSKELGFSEKTLGLAFEQFVRLNMINVADGVYSIRNWEKYQSVEKMDKIREQTRLRNKAMRDRKKRERDAIVTQQKKRKNQKKKQKKPKLPCRHRRAEEALPDHPQLL